MQAFATRRAEIRQQQQPRPGQEEARPGTAAKMFRPRSTKTAVSSAKMSPVLKQIISRRAPGAELQRQASACDSVEHSFKEKLSLQSRRCDKEEKELEVFEMLEGATLHSSFSRWISLFDWFCILYEPPFCSTNSAINSLWKQSILNSPAKSQEKSQQHERDDVSKQETFDSTNPSLGETLLNDIQCFLDKTKDNVVTAEVSRYFN